MKKWDRPRLIVLVRSKAEETLLSGCKGIQLPTGPTAQVGTCEYNGGFCGLCSTVNTS